VCKGKVFPKVEIHVTASGDDSSRSTYYKYELTNVRVTSYSVNGSGHSAGDAPMEQISLNFEEIKVSYDRAGTRGKSKGKVETTWKVEQGEK
jgi:type VI protein secretion system component Hcp